MKQFSGLSRYFLGVLLVFGLVLSGFADGDKGIRNRREKKGKKHSQEMSQKLLKSIPKEKRDKLKRLQKENPEAFRKEMQSLIRKYKARQLKVTQRKEVDELAAKYHSAEGEEKTKLLTTIKEKVTKQFHDKIRYNRENIAKTEKRLNELKSQLKKREENAEKIIQERVKFLAKDPNLRW